MQYIKMSLFSILIFFLGTSTIVLENVGNTNNHQENFANSGINDLVVASEFKKSLLTTIIEVAISKTIFIIIWMNSRKRA